MIDELVKAMARREGEFASGAPNLPQLNNNPLNLLFAGQVGAWCSLCGTTNPAKSCANGAKMHGFAKFGAFGVGWSAAYRQVSEWVQMGYNLEQLIGRQAPPSENDTVAYITFVLNALHSAQVQVDQTKPLHIYMP